MIKKDNNETIMCKVSIANMDDFITHLYEMKDKGIEDILNFDFRFEVKLVSGVASDPPAFS